MNWSRRVFIAALCAAQIIGAASIGRAQAPLRKIGELELSVLGLTAAPDPLTATVPKNTASGIRVLVKGGARAISPADLNRFLGADIQVQAELSGPGLSGSVTLSSRLPGEPAAADLLLLRLPALTTAGDYVISNVRLVAGGRPVLDVTPSRVPLKVIEQVLITSVKTRPLTLQEIKDKGIVLDRNDYLGFEFTLGVKLESKAVTVQLPVVFDRQGVPLPMPLAGVSEGSREAARLPDLPPIIPTMIDLDTGVRDALKISFPDTVVDVKIPALLVIPGNVGYLKQFFSAQLFVANGSPAGSGLSVHDVSGTILMPPGADGVGGTPDDPLALPATTRGPQSVTQAVTAVGPDGVPGTADDVGSLNPGEQGQVEFLLRGEKEGFHTINFDINATLEGLPIGPVPIKGKASGGVLVRNPFFDLSFAVPSIVRKGERFKIGVTVSNIGQGMANDVNVSLDASRMSGATLQSDAAQQIDTLKAGDAKTLMYEFTSDRTGQVVATYLHFDPDTAAGGNVTFTLGVGERGIPLSPDTFVLPAVADTLPAGLVDAALRVLGQAWSIANAPPDTLKPSVIPISKKVVTRKAQALAEAGLRASLGEPVDAAARDLGLDFLGGDGNVDPGFDQLLRQTEAGLAFAAAYGGALSAPSAAAGGVIAYHRDVAQLAASGPDQISWAVDASAAPAATLVASLGDTASNRATMTLGQTLAVAASAIPSAAFVPIGSTAALGVITDPAGGAYTLTLTADQDATIDVSVALPRGDGSVAHAVAQTLALQAHRPARIVLDSARADRLAVDQDSDGDAEFDTSQPLLSETLAPQGPTLVSATVVGPELVSGASNRGFSVAVLFDRVVDPKSAADVTHYAMPLNDVVNASTQLSGRLVFASLEQPEGPYVASSLAVHGLADQRGAVGPAALVPLGARLAEPGAVITGHVLKADATPIAGAPVVYSNHFPSLADSAAELAFGAFAAILTDAAGQFQYRYVIWDKDQGVPWIISAQDPSTGAVRFFSGFVRAPGEQVVLDIAMAGLGNVTGVVRDLNGHPVGGVHVAVISEADPQLSGIATTDGDGRYTAFGIAVGAVNVRASKGDSLGRSAGRLDRAGTTAAVNVTMDGGVVKVSGTVRRSEDGVTQTVPGANVVYRLQTGANTYQPIAVVQTDAEGRYAFSEMPVGSYQVDVTLDSRDHGSVTGVAAANDDLRDRDVVIEVTNRAHVRGILKFPNGSPASGVIVSIGDRGVLSGTDGTFDIPGVPIQLAVPRDVNARVQDGSRYGRATIFVNDPNPPEVSLTLSGLGNAEFTVLDSAGRPIANQRVDMLVPCSSACMCSIGLVMTNDTGVARFSNLKLGSVQARAYRIGDIFVDVAEGSALVPGDGQTGYGVLRFAGIGSVTGVVLMPDGRPAVGAEISLRSKFYAADSCNLVVGDSHRVHTGESGRFNLIGVNVGPVGVTASHPFLTTQVGAQGTLTRDGDRVDFTLRLVDTTAGELTGTVYLPGGVTNAGAGVEVTVTGPLPDYVVHTNEQGHFGFAKILPAGTYRLIARDPVTGGVVQEIVYLSAHQDAVHDLRLHARGAVRVRVVDGADQPIDNAVVTLTEQAFPNGKFDGVIEPANQGVITFDRVIEGSFSIEAKDSHARGGRAYSIVPRPDATGVIAPIDVKVRLSMTGSVRGHFYKPDGVTPVPFGIVRLTSNYYQIGQSGTSGLGDVGAFAFDFVPSGTIRVYAEDPLTGRTGIGVGTIDTEGQVLDLKVVAQGLGTVQGVVTSNGVPQPGAHVDIVSGTFKAATTSDADGAYVLPGVPEGRVVATASFDFGFLSGTASQMLTGDDTILTLDVPLHDSGTLTGVVFASDGVTPAPPSVVTLHAGGQGSASLTSSTDSSGAFRFDLVPAGLASINVDVLGSIDVGGASVEIARGGETGQNVVLNGVGSLSGSAIDSVGQPVEGDLRIVGTGAFGYTLSVHVGPDGHFQFPELLAGPFTAQLQASAGSLILFGSTAGTVTPNAESTITVPLQDSGTITGTIVRADAVTPAVGANVSIQLDGSRVVKVQAVEDGRFAARGVPLGNFSVSVNDPVTSGVALLKNQHLVAKEPPLDVDTLVLDDTPVAVVSIAPAAGATAVALNTPVTIVLTDPISSTYGISVNDGTNPIAFAASISADGRTVAFPGPWPQSKDLSVVITTYLSDVYGRHPSQTSVSHFFTVDTAPPFVTAVAPANLAFQVPVSTTVTLTFSEPLSASTDLTTLVTVAGPSGAIAGTTVLQSPTVALFTPAAPLSGGVSYAVTVNGSVDLSGNRQTNAFHSSFATPDAVGPVMHLDLPVNGALLSTGRPQIQISYSDAASGIDSATATLTLDGAPVAVQKLPTFMTFTPPANLADGLHAVTASVADRVGNASALSSSFTTDTTPPTVPVLAGVTEGQILSGPVALSAAATDATTGVARFDVFVDGSSVLMMSAPAFTGTWNTASYAEGSHALTVRAVDAVSNASALSPPVHVIVDNRATTISISAPTANTRVRDAVNVTATVSEPVDHVTFDAGTTTVTAAGSGLTYTANVPLATAPEGAASIVATAFGLLGETVTATVSVVIDRTPPAAPNAALIDAEPPTAGASLVFASAAAVEGGAVVRLTNTASGATAVATAAATGSFSVSIAAAVDDVLSIVASDSVGNQSAATLVAVRRVPSLPPAAGNTSLQYQGLLADRVGAVSGAITPDGAVDAVFTMSLTIGDGVTRTLSYFDLVGGSMTRSTRSEVGGPLGVAVDAGSPLLNNPNGTVAFPITTGATLTLFAANAGFIVPNGTYTATAAFTDGTRFLARVTIVAAEDQTAVAHSARIAASPATVRVSSAVNPGTSVLTLTDIRDIDGTRVPDGAKIAIAAADMASKDPGGAPIRSAGGAILDGTPAPNNPNFRVFTIANGAVTATYSSQPVMPAALVGALSVIQVIAADAGDNVLGTEAIATFDLNLRAATDPGTVVVSTSSFFVDKSDRRSHVAIDVPLPDGSKVAVTASGSSSIVNGAYVPSAGGTILGGATSPSGSQWAVFTVSGGSVQCDYAPGTITVGNRQTKTVNVQVVPANASGTITSSTPLATATITLTGAGSSEVRFTKQSLPVLTVAQTAQVIVHHVHDIRANLLPDGVNVLLTAAGSTLITPDGCCYYASVGGQITDGQVPSDSRFRLFPLAQGDVIATYSPATITTGPGDVKTASVSVTVADSSGTIIDQRAIGNATIQLLGPAFGTPGSVTPTTLLADGGAHVATATFGPILDSYGNTVPDGTIVLVSVAGSTGIMPDGCCYYSSVGGVLLDGGASASGASYHTYTVLDGSITATYADQNITATAGQQKTVTVMLFEATPTGAVANQRALGAVPLTLSGTTSATMTASVAAMHADGADRRSTITVSNIRDALGHPVPDGTQIGVTAAGSTTLTPDGCCYNVSAGGVILGGTVSSSDSRFRVFTVQNGQAVFEYSAQGVTVATGQSTARVQVVPVSQSGTVLTITSIATMPIQLLAYSSALVTLTPADLVADNGAHLSQLTIANLTDTGGALVPDGAKVAITVSGNVAIDPATNSYVQSAGGQLQSAGTTAGDGTTATNSSSYQVYTVAGGRVLASYSDVSVSAGVNETKVARVSVVGATTGGGIATSTVMAIGAINLRGTTSASASGPSSVARSGGTVQITFSGIRDSGGNVVPDGTIVAATATTTQLVDVSTNTWIQSTGGSIVDGTTSPSSSAFKNFSVQNGSITVTYSAAGASVGTARIYIGPALASGALNGNKALIGGIWPITVQ